jgi:hypothetical protein
MKQLVEFPSETGEPILVEVEDVGLAGETRRGLSPSAVVERAQTYWKRRCWWRITVATITTGVTTAR